MEGKQKPKNFTTPRDHTGSGVLFLQEQRQKEQQVALLSWGQCPLRTHKRWKVLEGMNGRLARYFLRFRRGDNILVDFDIPPCIWLIMNHLQNQEKWEKTTFQILGGNHVPDPQRRPPSRFWEKATFQIPDSQRRPHSRSSEKITFQIFREDHVPDVQIVRALKALSFPSSQTHRPL